MTLLCVSQITVAQDDASVNGIGNTERDTIIINTQPAIRERNATTGANMPDYQINSVVKLQGDPMKATMMSAVFPGGGQIYNRKYWKLPIVYAGFGALIYFIKTNTDNYRMYYKGYMDYTDNIAETNSYIKFISKNPAEYDPLVNPAVTPATVEGYQKQMLRFIDYHKRYRDLSIILTGVWYLAQILDANVDASLMGYDVSDNLELSLSPKMFNMPAGMTPVAGVNLCFTIAYKK